MQTKKTAVLVLICAALALARPTQGADGPDHYMHPKTIWSAQTVPWTTTVTSAAIDLAGIRPEGNYALQYAVSNATTTNTFIQTLAFEISNDGQTFFASNIVTDVWTNSGTQGKDIVQIRPIPARYLRFKATITNAPAVIWGWLVIQ